MSGGVGFTGLGVGRVPGWGMPAGGVVAGLWGLDLSAAAPGRVPGVASAGAGTGLGAAAAAAPRSPPSLVSVAAARRGQADAPNGSKSNKALSVRGGRLSLGALSKRSMRVSD